MHKFREMPVKTTFKMYFITLKRKEIDIADPENTKEVQIFTNKSRDMEGLCQKTCAYG